MARLVAMRILADQAGDVVGFSGKGRRGADGKQGIQFFNEAFLPAEQGNQVVRIVKDMPAVMPRIRFRKVTALLAGVRITVGLEGFAPGTVRILPAEKARGGIEEITIIPAPGNKESVIFLLAESPGKLGGAPVIIAGFKCPRDRFFLNQVERIIAVAVVYFPVGLEVVKEARTAA